jgi:hypothetical protein
MSQLIDSEFKKLTTLPWIQQFTFQMEGKVAAQIEYVTMGM